MKTFLEPLSPEMEAKYLQCMKNGDKMAKDELILHNMRLVAHVAKKYATAEEELEDLISIGTIGLIKAVMTFNQDYGSRFATYAIRCIDNEMLMHFRSRKKMRGEVSMFEPIGMDKEGNQIQLFDILECEEKDIAEEIEKMQQISLLKENIRQILSGREFYIIVKRYGLFKEKELTQREIANNLQISRSYVSRIEKKALEKLRKFLKM